MQSSHATGHFKTVNGQKYVMQLSKHWAHKPGTVIDADAGTIDFDGGFGLAFLVEPEVLSLKAHIATGGDLEHWKGIVESHLMRFAFREDAVLEWDS